MIINFRARGISRGTRKLARTTTLIQKKYIRKLLYFHELFRQCLFPGIHFPGNHFPNFPVFV